MAAPAAVTRPRLDAVAQPRQAGGAAAGRPRPLPPGTLRVLVLSARGLQFSGAGAEPVQPYYELACGGQLSRGAAGVRPVGAILVWNGLHTFDASHEMEMSVVVRDEATGVELARGLVDLAR
jgi:hypothetical protein